jgi:hypothetical protein
MAVFGHPGEAETHLREPLKRLPEDFRMGKMAGD